MARRTTITFRGEPDVEIEYEAEYDSGGNGYCVKWQFAEEHMRDIEPTEEEIAAICDGLASRELGDGPFD